MGANNKKTLSALKDEALEEEDGSGEDEDQPGD
jgi:hypothetical protein